MTAVPKQKESVLSGHPAAAEVPRATTAQESLKSRRRVHFPAASEDWAQKATAQAWAAAIPPPQATRYHTFRYQVHFRSACALGNQFFTGYSGTTDTKNPKDIHRLTHMRNENEPGT